MLGGEQAGYNDIGILTAPDGHNYAVAVMIRRTSTPLGQRMAAMQNAVRAVISFDQNLCELRPGPLRRERDRKPLGGWSNTLGRRHAS